MADLRASQRSAAAQLRGYAEALLMVAGSTLLGLALAPRWGNSSVDLLYLPAVLATAVLAGLGPALFAALLAALAYNFFFTAPHLTFRNYDPNDIVTVVVLFAVAVVTSQLAASVRRQARIARSPSCSAERRSNASSLPCRRERAWSRTTLLLPPSFWKPGIAQDEGSTGPCRRNGNSIP